TMVDMNILVNDAHAEQAHAVAPPTRTDDQILPSSKWVPIGKSNCVLDIHCLLDEQWFNLHKDVLRDALDITPTNDNNPYMALPSSDTLLNTSTLWDTPIHSGTCRQCLPRHPVLQILWGIIHHSNIDYAKRIWEESVQSIQTFLTDRKNLTTASREKKKTTHLLISIEHVAKYQQYLDVEHGKAEEGGAIESPKATKVTKPKAAKAIKPAGDKAPKPKPAPTQPKVVPKKKQKLVKVTPDEPSPAKISKGGLVGKIRKPRSPLKLVDEPSAEDIPGPARLVVIREPDSRRIQPLPDVQGKRKEKRRTPMPTKASRHIESPSLDAELALTDSETKSDNVVPKINTGDQDEGQAGPNPGNHDEGQDGPNLGKEEPGKTNVESKVQPMVSVPIHQDTSSVPPMTNLFIDLMMSQSGSPLLTSTATTSAVPTVQIRESQYSSPGEPVDEIVTDAVDWAMQSPLRARFSDLPIVDIKEILQQWMFEDNSYEAHEDHKKLKRRDLPRTPSGSPPLQPPPPPPSACASGAPGSEASSSFKSAASALQSMAWTTSNTRYESAGIFGTQEKDWWKTLPEEERPATPEPAWTIPSSNVSNVKNNWATTLVSSYETPAKNSLLAKTEDMTNFLKWCFQQKFYIDRHDSPSRRKDVRSHMQILNVVRIKAYSRYGYDYLSGIILQRADLQEHTIAEKDFKNLYPSDFEDLNLLLLQGHLKHLLGSDKRMLSTAVKLWTQKLVIRQWVEDFQLDIKSYQTQLNLTKPGWDATGYKFKHDYTIIESPRAVVFPVNNNERKIMRFNEIYKFSDDTLTRILEVLAYRVKEFKIKRLNPSMNT
nr:hypothetical protein [Tanacetum cinerariifolium]